MTGIGSGRSVTESRENSSASDTTQNTNADRSENTERERDRDRDAVRERDRSTSRGRNCSHTRSPHRHRHGHRRRRFRFKEKERNFIAAVCSMIVIVVLCTAMAEPNWFYLRGGGCRDGNGHAVHSLGVYQFFYVGHFEQEATSTNSHSNVHLDNKDIIYHYSPNPGDMMVDCVTPRIVQVIRSIIALIFIGIAFSIMAFFLDLAGPGSRMMKILRRNAVFNILAVVVCVTVNGFSFLVTQLLDHLQDSTKLRRYSKVEIRFDVSFYLIAAAGGLSVIAAACNLLKRYPPYDHHRDHQGEALLDDYDGMEFGVPQGSDYYWPVPAVPPPPAYSP